jgi:hypothetical protein
MEEAPGVGVEVVAAGVDASAPVKFFRNEGALLGEAVEDEDDDEDEAGEEFFGAAGVFEKGFRVTA